MNIDGPPFAWKRNVKLGEGEARLGAGLSTHQEMGPLAGPHCDTGWRMRSKRVELAIGANLYLLTMARCRAKTDFRRAVELAGIPGNVPHLDQAAPVTHSGRRSGNDEPELFASAGGQVLRV